MGKLANEQMESSPLKSGLLPQRGGGNGQNADGGARKELGGVTVLQSYTFAVKLFHAEKNPNLNEKKSMLR